MPVLCEHAYRNEQTVNYRPMSRHGSKWQEFNDISAKYRQAAKEIKRHSSESQETSNQEIETEFAYLVDRWLKETIHLSLIRDKIINPAYLQIIAMGSTAVPLILRELRDRPSHWFVALQALTKSNPAEGALNPREARDKWLTWGEENGLI